MTDSAIIDWLLEGDPALRWQVLRDLAGASPAAVERERARIPHEGWGRRLLARQGRDGRWASSQGPSAYRGLYIPKWTSTTYTLLLLRQLGLPAGNGQALAGCRELVEGAEWFPSGGLGYFASRRAAEPCVSAMVLSILEAFGYAPEPRERLAEFLLAEQKRDGGWNCDLAAEHSSFNTTCLALEALRLRPPTNPVRTALRRGREFLLRHHLYCSHRTGRPARPQFTRLAPLIGWQYSVLRGLELLLGDDAPRDPRAERAVALILRRRRADGRWNAVAPPPGALHMRLEVPGRPGRWTTLRCARVLRWWNPPVTTARPGWVLSENAPRPHEAGNGHRAAGTRHGAARCSRREPGARRS